MLEKLKSAEAKRLYELRKQTVEPVFGRIKWNLGMSRFLLKGLRGASAEAALICMVHNVLKCMSCALSMAYVTFLNALVFCVHIAHCIQYASTIPVTDTIPAASLLYPTASATF
jgi:hypothetical protein